MFPISLLCIFFANNVYGSVCTQNLGSGINYNCQPGTYPSIEQGGCVDCPQGYYCPGGRFALCCNLNTNGNFPESAERSDSIDDCYKNIDCHSSSDSIEQCKHYYNGQVRDCPTIRDAHIEYINGIAECYADTRSCKLFNSDNCSPDQISGMATRFANHYGSGWTIRTCKCDTAEFEDSTELFCHGQQNGIRPSLISVQNAGATITYDGSIEGYYCTRCIYDTDSDKYYANTTYSNDTCSLNTTQGHICKCETSNNFGYWRKGLCNTNINWSNENNICQRIPCSAGKTTSEILPTATNDSICHYSPQTKFCDANGCFNITDASDWSWGL